MRIVLLHEQLAQSTPAQSTPAQSTRAQSTRADERDVFVQLALVERELEASGHRCHRLALDLDLERARRWLSDVRPELVFNLVESLGGSSRLAHLGPALVESLGIPCAGASSTAFLETTDKLHAKRRLAEAGLPTPAWFEAGDENRIVGRDAKAPFIVKPIHEDASVDLDDGAVVQGAAAARARVAAAARPSFAEAYVEGRELNLSLLAKDSGVELLPPAEISFEAWPEGKPRIVGYAAKWDEHSFESVHTPRRFDFPPSDAPLLARLADLSHRCWRLFGLGGWARVDFRVDAQGEPWILEINANPCLSPDAGFPAAAARAGLSTRDVLTRIVAAALSRAPRMPGSGRP